MWRDVYQGVVGLYYDIVHHLESMNMLDPDNELHLFCLQSLHPLYQQAPAVLEGSMGEAPNAI